MRFYNKKQAVQKRNPKETNEQQVDKALYSVSGSVPRSILKKLKNFSEEKKVPVSVLVARAICNEIDADQPFNFNTEMPDVPYVSMEYISESVAILNYVRKYAGLSLEQIIQAKDDMGLPDAKSVLLGYRELAISDPPAIDEYYPLNPYYPHPPYYRVVRLAHDERVRQKESNRYKKFAIQMTDEEFDKLVKERKQKDKGPLDEI